jgi:hypothetical protein
MFNIFNLFKKKENLLIDYIVVEKHFENNECIICLDNMKIGDKIKILDCGHIYHYNCINDWFKRKKECPLCYK